MAILSGYQILSQIYESANSLVYRGIRNQDQQSVILKVLKQEYPTPAELTHYKQEYEITCNLSGEGVIRAYDLIPYQKTLAIVLEDFGGESLDQWLQRRRGTHPEPLSLAEFLSLGMQSARGLSNIHTAQVIHKDINPSNIVVNAKTGQLKIIDFGISTALGVEMPTLKHPNVLEGSLPYLSPEQTGRMNRNLDYRTDFYSLGATFYELLTGQLPFETEDAMELVHAHLARQPVPPHEVNPGIHSLVSAIVLKLMAKNAEDRYQSAHGLLADLEECWRQWQESQEIIAFPIGRCDVVDRLQIPQKLYGRDQEVQILLDAFERVASLQENPVKPGERDTQPWEVGSGKSEIQNPKSKILSSATPDQAIAPRSINPKSELILVAGYSGIGKSVLVQELYKPITQQAGYFISGKFDQFQRNIPYSAIFDAFTGLVQQLLGEPEERLKVWREKLLQALGANGQVIIDVIPQVELIIGKQPPVPELEGAAAQNRFNLTFEKFIRVFCTKDHPLTIFLDDLQWADLATLKLLEVIMGDAATESLLLLGSYRHTDVGTTHPLMITVGNLQRAGSNVKTFTLLPLSVENIAQLVADTLHQPPEAVKDLAALIYKKTEGNPFFIGEFLVLLSSVG